VVISSVPANVSTAVVPEPIDLTVPSFKYAVCGLEGMDISGSPGVGPNAERVGDTACPCFRSSEEMLSEAASEFPLPIVRAAERADGREDAEPIEYSWSCRERGAELSDRIDAGFRGECIE
jgi:hypothetical protein